MSHFKNQFNYQKKYMKRIKIINGILVAGLSVLAVALLTGCTKELNQTPQSTANNSTVFGTLGGLQLYASSFYGQLESPDSALRGDDEYGDADFGARNSIPLYLQGTTFN